MGRGNGGLIGGIVPTTWSAAGGRWGLNDAAGRSARVVLYNENVWPPLPDSSFSSVSLLLHCNAFSTTGAAVNTGNSGQNATILGTLNTVSLRKWWGQAATNYLSSGTAAAYNYGSGDFTLEFWFYPTSVGSGVVWDQRPAGTNGLYPSLYTDGSSNMRYYTNSADRITGTGGLLTNNAWHHIAVCKASGSTKMFIDGTQNGSTYADGNTYLQGPIVIGSSSFSIGTSQAVGYYQEPRATKGVGRYTANFTVPSAPFADY
jgi:hypothetical protein